MRGIAWLAPALVACTDGRICGVPAGSDVVDPCGLSADGGAGGSSTTPDPGPVPAGTVGVNGGSVERLWFATTGDTRPPQCDQGDRYPREAIARIARSMKALRVQFAIDLGDHLFVCGGGDAEARRQMGSYMEAVAQGPATFWMTMGNHECGGAVCLVGGAHDANFAAFLSALQRPRPWYWNDVATSLGSARLVVIADDSWDEAQARWLEAALAEADARAKYTIVARHHPLQGSRTGPAEILDILRRHRLSLILTAHNHDYEHDPAFWDGRSVVVGLGGAGGRWGFGTVLQQPDGRLEFVRRDASGNPVGTAWSVAP